MPSHYAARGRRHADSAVTVRCPSCWRLLILTDLGMVCSSPVCPGDDDPALFYEEPKR